MRFAVYLMGLVAACLSVAQAHALPFWAGNLIVSTENEILEVDWLSSEIVDRLDLVGVIAPCFLPNGNLLAVGNNNTLFEITPDGEVVREIDVDISDVAITDVLVGPTGAVWVRVESQLVRIDLETGEVLNAIELAGRIQPCFLPNGNLLVPIEALPGNDGSPGGDFLLEVDADTGEVLRAVEIPDISAITGATPGPAGLLILTTLDEIVLVDPVSGAIADRLALAGIQEPCFLPNGQLLVIVQTGGSLQALDQVGGALQVIDLASGEAVATLVARGVTGFTMVPFRFQAVVQGTLASNDELSTVEEAGELALSPGMRRMTLQADPSGNLSALFEAETLVLFGFEAPDAAARQLYQGSQIASPDLGPQASMGLRVVGLGRDPLKPTSARGSLHVASGEGIFLGNVTTSKLLNR
jgi:hypothetical protein